MNTKQDTKAFLYKIGAFNDADVAAWQQAQDLSDVEGVHYITDAYWMQQRRSRFWIRVKLRIPADHPRLEAFLEIAEDHLNELAWDIREAARFERIKLRGFGDEG